MFLPSLLEYSKESLQDKLSLVQTNISKFKTLQQNYQNTTLGFHLDFVLPQFAKDRAVMTSLGLADIFRGLDGNFSSTKLTLSVHLMGALEDLEQAYNFFYNYQFNPNWAYLLLVPENQFLPWQNEFNAQDNLQTGIWYDDFEWADKQFNLAKNYLLMTVRAGKSGQKLTPEMKDMALSLAKLYPQYNFIVDGGWSIAEENRMSNLDIVSYSSFWQKFELI